MDRSELAISYKYSVERIVSHIIAEGVTQQTIYTGNNQTWLNKKKVYTSISSCVNARLR